MVTWNYNDDRDDIFAVLADLQRRVENLELVVSGGKEQVAESASKKVVRPWRRRK
jgi:hypothetical protein